MSSHYYLWKKPEWKGKGFLPILNYIKENDNLTIVHDFFRLWAGYYIIELENVKEETIKHLYLHPLYDDNKEDMNIISQIVIHLDMLENNSENLNASNWRYFYKKWKETGVYE